MEVLTHARFATLLIALALASTSARSDPGDPLANCRTRTLGSSQEVFARLLPLLVDGSKTGTFALLASHEQQGEPVPRAGDCYLVTHFDGSPALYWRIVEVEIVAFGAITERHLQLESPALREVIAWRAVHSRAWSGAFSGLSAAQVDAMPVVVQRFIVLKSDMGSVHEGSPQR